MKDATTLPIRELKPLIGAEVLLDKAALISGAHAKELRALMEDRGAKERQSAKRRG